MQLTNMNSGISDSITILLRSIIIDRCIVHLQSYIKDNYV